MHEALDTTTPGGRLVFHVFAAPAGFIRELIVEGTYEGPAAHAGLRAGSLDAECEAMCSFFAHVHHERFGHFPGTGSGSPRARTPPAGPA